MPCVAPGRVAGFLTVVGLGGALLAVNGCGKHDASKPAGPPAETAFVPQTLNHALPKLATIKLWLGDQELSTEVARTATELQTGMMFRTNLAESEAMLFVFGRPMRAAFYMRNTIVPLSSAYIDPDGTILELHDLKPRDETPVEAASDNVLFVLETTQGWFQRHHIGAGTVVRTEHGALRELNWATLRPYPSR